MFQTASIVSKNSLPPKRDHFLLNYLRKITSDIKILPGACLKMLPCEFPSVFVYSSFSCLFRLVNGTQFLFTLRWTRLFELEEAPHEVGKTRTGKSWMFTKCLICGRCLFWTILWCGRLLLCVLVIITYLLAYLFVVACWTEYVSK